MAESRQAIDLPGFVKIVRFAEQVLSLSAGTGPCQVPSVTDIGLLWAFAGVMVLGQFSPGPDMLLLTRTALRDGPRVGIKMALGIASGLMVHATLAVGGITVAIERLPVLHRVLLWVAALYLLWLAFCLFREIFAAWHSEPKIEIKATKTKHTPFIRGLLCNLLNPKGALFLAAVCTPFLAGTHPGWWPYAIWAAVVGLGGGLWSLWVIVLQWHPLRRGYEKASLWIDALFSVALTILAVILICNS